MKKYIISLLVGLLLGVAFYLGAELLTEKSVLFMDFQYHLFFIPIFLIFVYTPLFRKQLAAHSRKAIFLV